MGQIKIFEYEGTPITFNNGENVMVNATEMAKPFGKSANDWLRTEQSKRMIEAIAESKKCETADLVHIKQGGNDKSNQGTWMHEDVALVFAQWLSPNFYIWCNDRIKELMKYGVTATPQTIESIIADPANMIKVLTALQEERKAKSLALADAAYKKHVIEEKEKVIAEQTPSVNFANAIVGSKSSILVGELAKILRQNGCRALIIDGVARGMGQNNLQEWFRKNHVFGTVGERYNIPNQRYIEQGLFELKTNCYSQNGTMMYKNTTKVTGKGQKYWINYFLPHLKTTQLDLNLDNIENPD